MKKILFGTNNAHKLREIREILAGTYKVFSLADLQIVQDVEETEETLEGNAILKAKAFYQISGIPCFADDTGLEVDALHGAPGVYSARYAGEGCTFQDNVNKLLGALQGKSQRTARFRTVIAYYDGQQTLTFEGAIEGIITETQSGSGGFGYDPIFQPENSTKTFAEMAPNEKNAISHRGRAVRKFVAWLLG